VEVVESGGGLSFLRAACAALSLQVEHQSCTLDMDIDLHQLEYVAFAPPNSIAL